MQDFDVSLDPGQTRQINIQADYIYYRAGSAGGADASLEFAPLQGGESVFLYPGQSYRLPRRSQGLGSAWMMKNRKGEARIIGSVLLGEGAFQDNRISGAVEVIDGGRNRTLANQAFQGGAYATGLAGNFPQVQLFNPIVSTRRIVIGRVSTSTANGGAVGIVITNAAMGTYDRKASSKLSGGASSLAELRIGNTVAVPAGAALASNSAPPNTQQDRTYMEPLVLLPGYGLNVYANAQGVDVVGSFEFCEEAI